MREQSIHVETKGMDMERFKRNEGDADRAIRALVIAPAAIAGAIIVGPASVGGILLLLVAAIMVGTAAVGTCPLYVALGLNTRRADCGEASPSSPR